MDSQTPLKDELEKNIRKLIKPLRDEEELAKILKLKLTKKEFKIFKNWANSENLAELLEQLSIDEERYSSLRVKLIKKLNQEKFKQYIIIY